MFGYEIYHDALMESIIDSVRSEKNPHAYIFEGEAGLGKHTAARLVANAAVCEAVKSAPCGSCNACVMARADTYPDIKYITADDSKKTISVDTVRGLNSDTIVKPFYKQKKVYIIDGDLLTPQAQNAFLKSLEEPPEYVLFIIIVSDITKLLTTVISRCACVKFPPLPKAKIKSIINEKYPTLGDSALFYVSFAEGNPKKLDSIVTSSEFSVLRDDCFKAAACILSKDLYDSFFVSEFFDTHKEQLPEVLDILLLFFRDILLLGEGFEKAVINPDYSEKLKRISGQTLPEKVLAAAKGISVCGEMKSRNVGAKYIGMHLALYVKEDRQ